MQFPFGVNWYKFHCWSVDTIPIRALISLEFEPTKVDLIVLGCGASFKTSYYRWTKKTAINTTWPWLTALHERIDTIMVWHGHSSQKVCCISWLGFLMCRYYSAYVQNTSTCLLPFYIVFICNPADIYVTHYKSFFCPGCKSRPFDPLTTCTSKK